MKLVQINDPKSGCITAKLEDGKLYRVGVSKEQSSQLLDFVHQSVKEQCGLATLVSRFSSTEPLPFSWDQIDIDPDPSKPHLTIPIHPPEVWACGVTYKKSAEFRDEDTQTSKGIYDHVYSARRPELFFKGTESRCTGPNDFIGIRADSAFTAVEPELAVLVNSRKEILGFTVANDVSAWDIERENPLYLPQSKIFLGCCSLGPVLLTADSVPDPYALSIKCEIKRGAKVLFSGETSLGMMKRKIEELIDFLFFANSVPDGTVLLTGTGIIQTEDAALREGDVVEITIPEIGKLRNTAKRVG